MKKIILCSLIAFGISNLAFAQDTEGQLEAWQIEKQKLEADVLNMSNTELSVKWTQMVVGTTMACGLSHTVVFTSLVADTVPVANIISEIAANMADEDYESVASDDLIGQLQELLKGSLAGAGALIKDIPQYVLLLWSGEPENAWKSLERAYGSTIVLADKLNQDKALCPRMSRAELIMRKELLGRLGYGNIENQLPLESIQIPQP